MCSPAPASVEVRSLSGERESRYRGGEEGERGGKREMRGEGEKELGLVSGGLVFFNRRQRNLGGACSRVPAEDSDGERAHHKENQAGRG